MCAAVWLLLAPAAQAGGAREMQAASAGLQAESVRRMRASVARQRAVAEAWRPKPDRGGRFSRLSRPAEFAALPVARPAIGCGTLPEPELAPLVDRASRETGLAAALLRAVIGQESAFDPCAVSPKGALGLMQLMPSTARELEVTDPFDPEQNVAAGSRYLMQLLMRYGGSLPLALGAYNAGPARVDALLSVPPIAETQDFVQRVLGRLGGLAAVQD